MCRIRKKSAPLGRSSKTRAARTNLLYCIHLNRLQKALSAAPKARFSNCPCAVRNPRLLRVEQSPHSRGQSVGYMGKLCEIWGCLGGHSYQPLADGPHGLCGVYANIGSMGLVLLVVLILSGARLGSLRRIETHNWILQTGHKIPRT